MDSLKDRKKAERMTPDLQQQIRQLWPPAEAARLVDRMTALWPTATATLIPPGADDGTGVAWANETAATDETESDRCWQWLSNDDRNYLLAPRVKPQPCPWCGGRLRHSALCQDLHAWWAVRLDFGKFRGRRIQDIPVTYLEWLIRFGAIRDKHTRAAVRDLLGLAEEFPADQDAPRN